MSILTIIAGLTAVTYITYAIIKNKGIPDSISATAYAVKYKKTFTVAMCAVAALLLPELLNKTNEATQFLPFLAIAGLGAVGLSPDYRNEGKFQHYFGAFLAATASQLTIALNDPKYLLGWLLFPIFWGLNGFKNTTFWAEIICFLTMFLYILL